MSSIVDLSVRFLLNFIITGIIVLKLYFPTTRHKEYVFTYFIISVSVFMLSFLLSTVKIELGVALGLFAIFGIIRYRTTSMPIREMTYLFAIIALSVANAVAHEDFVFPELIAANLMVLILVGVLEKLWMNGKEQRKTIIYEKIELIKPNKREELIKDISARTGLNISRVEIGQIDFLKDVAKIVIYFDKESSNSNLSDFEVGMDSLDS